MTAATMSSFQRLPAELCARIWELSIEPRFVEVRVVHCPSGFLPVSQTRVWKTKRSPPTRHLRSPTLASAQLQVCREARDLLTTHSNRLYRYQKAFSEIATTRHEGFDAVPEHDAEAKRYVWFNFEIDVFSIGDTDLGEFWAVSDQIRRLRLRREIAEEYFARTEYQLIGKWYKNLVEVQLVVLEGIRAAYSYYDEMEFPCGPEDVYWVDPVDGMMLNSVELDALVIREHEEVYGLLEHDSCIEDVLE